ncbi:MAG: peptidoglycan-binding protein, partial [Clostridia bacterium]|nr:peptidoglycan-binding protein [Clostridia bacterium]
MHKFKLAALGLMAVLIALVMCACGPEEDTTDDLLISVEVPFSTTSVLTTPSTIELTGWSGERVILNDGEYSVLTRDPVSIGDDVRKLQNRLIELGYLSNEKNATSGNYKRANGKFDVATEQAVEKFEAAYGRSPTGVATELMQY